MLDWEIEDQKLFLFFLIERNRPFPPNDENSANMDFNKDVYTIMGTGQNVPNKTKDNIGNLYQNLKKKKEPEWIALYPQYRQFFNRVVEIYVDDDDDDEENQEQNSFELPPHWLKEKNILLEASRKRHKEWRAEKRHPKSSGARVSLEGLKRKLDESTGAVESPRQRQRDSPAEKSVAFHPKPPSTSFSTPSTSSIASSRSQAKSVAKTNSAPTTIPLKFEPTNPSPARKPAPDQNHLEEIKNIAEMVKQIPEILARVSRMEALALQNQAQLVTMGHTINLLTTGLIGRGPNQPLLAYDTPPIQVGHDRTMPDYHEQRDRAPPVQENSKVQKESAPPQVRNIFQRLKTETNEVVQID